MDFRDLVRKGTDKGAETAFHPVSIIGTVGTLMATITTLLSWPHLEENFVIPAKSFLGDVVHGVKLRQDVQTYLLCDRDWECVEEARRDVIQIHQEAEAADAAEAKMKREFSD